MLSSVIQRDFFPVCTRLSVVEEIVLIDALPVLFASVLFSKPPSAVTVGFTMPIAPAPVSLLFLPEVPLFVV